MLGRGGPQGLQVVTGPGFTEEAHSRAGEGTQVSPGAVYKTGSSSGRELAQDPRSSVAELELSEELAKLLIQRVHLECVSASTANCPGGRPASRARNSCVDFSK